MTRRFFMFLALALAGWSVVQISMQAGEPVAALTKSEILAGNVACLRVREVGTNLPDEISAAQTSLSATNKIVGTVLDLRFANGDDSAAADVAAKLFSAKKMPLAILVNGQTRGAAAALAAQLRAANAGIVIGSTNFPEKISPDITVAISTDAEKKFLQNPFATTAATNVESAPVPPGDLVSFVDHTTEAELVRKKIKDGEEEGDDLTPRVAPSSPLIRDPALARAVDLLQALTALRQPRG